MKLLRKIFFETERNSFSIVSRKHCSADGGLHRFDAFDRVDLVRTVFALTFLDLGEKGPQDFSREIHQSAVERRGGEKREHE